MPPGDGAKASGLHLVATAKRRAASLAAAHSTTIASPSAALPTAPKITCQPAAATSSLMLAAVTAESEHLCLMAAPSRSNPATCNGKVRVIATVMT